MKRIGIVMILILTFGPANAIDAGKVFDDPEMQARYEKIVSEVRCLVCQNQAIKDSNAFLAGDLRREIRRLMEEGRSDAEVYDFLVTRYGDFVLYRPRMKGKTMALWIAPFLLIAVGGIVAIRVVRGRMTLPIDDDTDEIMIWMILGIMLLVAVAVVVWPLAQHKKGLSLQSLTLIVFVVVLSAGIYATIGTPQGKSAGSEMASIEEMVAGLDKRLQDNPDDLAGWKMLGRSYSQLGKYDEAIEAFERAVQIESGANGQTLVNLGEAVWMRDQRTLTGRAGELFENAIAISPNNPKALFYGGLVAVERGERFLAAERWEALLALSPPEGVQEILQKRVAELRGEETAVEPVPAGPIVAAAIELAPVARDAVDPNATVFIIARDPAQPRPPIAAVRRRVSELPAVISLSDSDAMIPGRLLSGFSELEIVARVSMSGQPVAQAGDWYGEKIVRLSETGEVSIVIDREVK